ncbi:hypothetical protein GCM10023093_09930 [Nemorincola caseinilytica]|uniref:Fido domain-containing protein n=1 Tax=Nemorincola caseinilytica TaxID=2054315 RepID=A0ABP8N7Q0_9BACT
MITSLNKVDILTKQLRELLPMDPADRQRLTKKFRLEFNYNSNHIEGNTLTYGETELLLILGDTKGSHTMREYEEMNAHDLAFQMVEEWAKDKERPLTERDIKNLNEIILVRPFWKDAITPEGNLTRRMIKVGDYKEYPNSVRLQNGEVFEYARPSDVPILMQELIDWYRSEEGSLHPVVLAAMLHYKFVRIHPFDDGNGRISRLLMNYVMFRNDLPPVIIRSSEKVNYLHALNRADIGDHEVFIDYVAQQVIWSLELAIKAANGENIDEVGDLDKKLAQLKRKIAQVSDNRVELKRSIEVIRSVARDVIAPIAIEWENKLKEFDTFFFSRSVHIAATGTGKQGISMSETFDQFYKEQLAASLKKGTLITEIKLMVSFIRLRSVQNNTNYNGGEIKFLFHMNAYEIECTGLKKSISKLYDQTLSKNEIMHIVDHVGNWFLNNIEKVIENGGS